jgi:hypothetical protein
VDFARISGTVTCYPQGTSLCAIVVIQVMIVGIVVMSMVIVGILVARVWDDRGDEERGN